MNNSRYPNFSPGPATLPESVLLEVQQELLSWHKKGFSVMEISHRGEQFLSILQSAKQRLTQLLNLSDEFEVLFLQGGARMQFAQIPMNFLQNNATYLNSGYWSHSAFLTAQNMGNCVEIRFEEISSEKFDQIKNSDYLHYCPNETLTGVAVDIPQADCPVMGDFSSTLLSEPINTDRLDLIYACSQKNIACAGLTLVIVKKPLLARCAENIPNIFNYQKQAAANSLLNTPPTFAIYLADKVFAWLLQQGGLIQIAKVNARKATLIYDILDSSDFYTAAVPSKLRSKMNILFNLPTQELEQQFLQEAEKQHLYYLKGHKQTGGIRVSLYNAISLQWVEQLAEFMRQFIKRH